METVSIKMEEDFVSEVEKMMKKHNYTTKTEFIREAIRDKINDLEKEAALLRLKKAYGAGAKNGRKISDADVHRAGEKVVKELAKELGANLE